MSKATEISEEKLNKYISIAEKAIALAEKSNNKAKLIREREDCLDMIKRYFSDALHFKKKGDFVNAFGAIYYAHAWLDAGARLGLFDVKHNSELFTVD